MVIEWQIRPASIATASVDNCDQLCLSRRDQLRAGSISPIAGTARNCHMVFECSGHGMSSSLYAGRDLPVCGFRCLCIDTHLFERRFA